jgi:hypothetical protein
MICLRFFTIANLKRVACLTLSCAILSCARSKYIVGRTYGGMYTSVRLKDVQFLLLPVFYVFIVYISIFLF